MDHIAGRPERCERCNDCAFGSEHRQALKIEPELSVETRKAQDQLKINLRSTQNHLKFLLFLDRNLRTCLKTSQNSSQRFSQLYAII